MKILVVEDEMVISMNLVLILENLGYEVMEPVTTYEEAVTQLEKECPDLAILDVNIDGIKSGIDVAHHINDQYNIPFIYLTSNSDSVTVTGAKATKPASYLIKPFSEETLYSTIEIALFNFQDRKNTEAKSTNIAFKDSVFVKNKNMFYKVKFEDILYVKSDHVYLELFTKNNEKHVIRGGLTSFAEKLPKNFYRTHRSYLVNLDYLDAINSINVIINKIHVPIGKTYRTDLMASIHIE